tara:strand:+ start:6964 stop:7065 length:102 start_codon:yes stop_codon:yes gene_type:complete
MFYIFMMTVKEKYDIKIALMPTFTVFAGLIESA